jgi:hypothetical protein
MRRTIVPGEREHRWRKRLTRDSKPRLVKARSCYPMMAESFRSGRPASSMNEINHINVHAHEHTHAHEHDVEAGHGHEHSDGDLGKPRTRARRSRSGTAHPLTLKRSHGWQPHKDVQISAAGIMPQIPRRHVREHRHGNPFAQHPDPREPPLPRRSPFRPAFLRGFFVPIKLDSPLNVVSGALQF